MALAAIEHDRNNSLALALHGFVTGYAVKDYAMANQLLERALVAGPNCALAWTFSSILRTWFDDGPGAIARAERGLRLAPFDSFTFMHEYALGQAYYIADSYDEAALWGYRSLAKNPRHAPAVRSLIVSLVAAGRRDEVCSGAQRLLQIEPSFRLSTFAVRTPLRGEVRDRYIDRLRAAGLPE